MQIKSTQPAKINYINNKELLLEIHNSKKTFCSFLEPHHANYDAIVSHVDDIVPELIEKIRLKKSSPRGKPSVPLDSIPFESIVVRVMTYEHIPLDPDRVRKSRVTDQSYSHTTFIPFKHYVLLPDGPKEVCRSHWEGGFDNGHFVAYGGKINNRLAKMFMMLVDRYSRRGNFRGYCVDTETEALTKRGWLNYKEINEDDTILSYDNGQLKWSSIKSIYRGDYDGKMFKLTGCGIDALVSPGHKFVTAKDGLKPAEYLLETDRLVLMGDAVDAPSEEVYPNAFVELVGWIVTEGNFYHKKNVKSTTLTIYQNEGIYADRIRNCFDTLGEKYSQYSRNRTGNVAITFTVNTKLTTKIIEEIGKSRALPAEFIMKLTASQRELLIQTMIDADGWRTKQGTVTHVGYCQKSKKHMDTFLMLCTLAGYQTTVRKRDIVTTVNKKISHIYEATLFNGDRRKVKRVENIEMHGAKRSGTIKGRGKSHHQNVPTEDYNGIIWCPQTEYGCFVSRRNGQIYINGNTYVDEMRSLALVQLSQVALQFNESKSDNPFAFYTAIIRNCFVRIINLEKKSQNIRDDLLIKAGAKPSYTRQIDNELEARFAEEKKLADQLLEREVEEILEVELVDEELFNFE